MKYISEMTEKEILELTDSELNRMFKLKLAMEGIPLVMAPEEPTYDPIPEPDITVYEVSKISMMFLERIDADAVCGFMNEYAGKMKREDYDSDYNRKFLVDFDWSRYSNEKDGFTVTTKRVYSRELSSRIADAVKSNNTLEKDYKEKKTAYNKAMDEAQWVKDEIYDKWSSIKSKYSNFEDMLFKFRQYLELADNSNSTAWKFFHKAHSVSNECEEYIKAKIAVDGLKKGKK